MRPRLNGSIFSWLENLWVSTVNRLLVRFKHYIPIVHPYISFGNTQTVRLFARVILGPKKPNTSVIRRGFRSLFTAQAPGVEVRVEIDGWPYNFAMFTDRGGYINHEVEYILPPGMHDIVWNVYDSKHEIVHSEKSKMIVAPGFSTDSNREKRSIGIISDIDDTILVSQVPRPLVAAWMMLVRSPHNRDHVNGMPEFYQELNKIYDHPMFFYLSASPWNIFATLKKFILMHGFPFGPLLLRDWGPTDNAIFEKAEDFKNRNIDRLMKEFPQTDWIMIGDNGQRDVRIYRRAASLHTGRVKAIIIRELSATEQLLTTGLPFSSAHPESLNLEQMTSSKIPVFYAPDGAVAIKLFKRVFHDDVQAAELRLAQPKLEGLDDTGKFDVEELLLMLERGDQH